MKSVPLDIFSSRIVAWTLLTLICSRPLRAQSTYAGGLYTAHAGARSRRMVLRMQNRLTKALR